jgi:hypothetical protein
MKEFDKEDTDDPILLKIVNLFTCWEPNSFLKRTHAAWNQ